MKPTHGMPLIPGGQSGTATTAPSRLARPVCDDVALAWSQDRPSPPVTPNVE